MAEVNSSAATQVKLDVTGFAKTSIIPQIRVEVNSWTGDPGMEDNNKAFTEVAVGKFRWVATVSNDSSTWVADTATIDPDQVDIARVLVMKAVLSSGACNPFNGVYAADDYMFALSPSAGGGICTDATDIIQFNDALVWTGHHDFTAGGGNHGDLVITVTDPGTTSADQGYLDLYFMIAGYKA